MTIEVRDTGTILYDGIVVGAFDQDTKRLRLNLGWLSAAGLGLTVEGDPSIDRRRILLARPGITKASPVQQETLETAVPAEAPPLVAADAQ